MPLRAPLRRLFTNRAESFRVPASSRSRREAPLESPCQFRGFVLWRQQQDAIQEYVDVISWIDQSGDPLGFVPHIRKDPLEGQAPKAVILQFAKGDETVPNPTTTALIRAGDLEDRTTYFRNDIAFSLGVGFGKNPHTFLTNLGGTLPVAQVAVGAQEQIAIFFATGGAVTIDPDGPGPLFEVPIVPPLPEDLNFIP